MGGGGSLLDFFSAALDLITGPLGIILMALGIGFMAIRWLFNMSDERALGRTIAGCGILYGAAWLAQELTGGGGI